MMLEGLTILLVEDDYFILQDLKISLSRQGAQVTTATSVVTGMAVAKKDYDVAILDIRLEDQDVLPIAQELDARNVPLIFHSAVAERSEVARAFPSAKSLSKPTQEVTLLEAVLDATKRG